MVHTVDGGDGSACILKAVERYLEDCIVFLV